MISKWYELKPKARKLRAQGFSIRDIEQKLGIPRSTLSGWLKDIKLSPQQKQRLIHKRDITLVKNRKKASQWHRDQKEIRIREAKSNAKSTLSKIDLNNNEILKLSLAILYLGEGFKKTEVTAIGNSDPQILRFLLQSSKKVILSQFVISSASYT